MILVDKKILGFGMALVIAGVIVTVTGVEPASRSGMTEEEIVDLMIAEDENKAYQMLSGILVGVGFLLVLISFGARRKRDGAKRTEKKPEQG